ncbi:hypothetical protein SPRG_11488 [Saprolegnia parasitica CBS 223.65]|uniref:Kinesin motor domain-containing protein n=1 Tax=Saprolegnia parasitica (strain CBS 223.65) TaxID=695850 RepID=A0A067CA24_SAPPC|nr:hypothetical protein SPRG_11488 [Saprolegnia parasitica CBS 223.65]KDO23396.1 hypothetical protein SPRG_11488 [Saprolegnia parasitica CBS 223.65]|eukprot:XP_012205885.1 hypothetical protein SPRG_11488 [Saprolegnia parasitica CBS 223.65]
MSVSIKVCIRCRPFTIDDTLGVVMTQKGDEEGEVELINSTYSTTRFAFSWAWWSAYGYKRHVKGDSLPADNMLLVDQAMAYEACGAKIKDDLLGGNAVVMFAYGLSGSGKTFTVFGPDAVDIPEAWFKHEEPHPLWGIFPRLAYNLFKEKQDGWKITMKYFQNVVDTVRDLMSPMAQEQQYKNGMRKDADGFMDIEWCQGVVLKDWNDLRRTFMSANSRKAIAPTQFNHQSTRGHCIMTLEVEKPDPEREGMKQRGRIYVCDLAGTEPAGDIVYANYQKLVFDDGSIEMKYLGPHQDASKSKELQDQGKKINLSLTEMAQFFMKMAEAVQKKTLKPGASIPGCNSYFLCKYLKDTMLQARTYLFCAVRPEVTYLNYTFSTLGFAKNASVIKLQPKKASAAASPAERKLMAELDEMKNLVAMLKAENEKMAKMGGGGGGSDQVDKISALLAQKQRELEGVLSGETSDGGDGGSKPAAKAQEEAMQRQKEEYEKRGISLTFFEEKTTLPYLINLDVDAYRSQRFMYLLTKEVTIVGTKGDIKPMALSVVDGHCSFEKSPPVLSEAGADTGSVVTLVGGNGDTMHNGKKLEKGTRVELAAFDRVVIGNELMLFRYPGREDPGKEPPTADDAAHEFQEALQSQDKAAMQALEAQRLQFEAEKAAWEEQKAQAQAARSEALSSATPEEVAEQERKLQELEQQEKERLARQVNDQELRDVLPKINELKQIVHVLNRDVLSFETALKGTGGDGQGIPQVKVKVHNSKTDETILLDVFEFVKAYSLLKDEVAFLKNAIANNREYTSPMGHDPITLLFDNSFHVGSATNFPEYLLYNLETDPDESRMNIKNAVPPFNTIGKLEVVWTPLSAEDEAQHNPDHIQDIDGPMDLVGKSWTYKLEIKGATGLPMITDLAYVQYEFLGELFTTESVEQNTRNPVFNYSHVHHVPCVTAEFVQYLQTHRLEFQLYINPYILDPPKDAISTGNPTIVSLLGGTATAKLPYDELEVQCKKLEVEKQLLSDEIVYLRQTFKAATGQEAPAYAPLKASGEATADLSTPRKQLAEAKSKDALLNTETPNA